MIRILLLEDSPTDAELVRYANSGDVSGDYQSYLGRPAEAAGRALVLYALGRAEYFGGDADAASLREAADALLADKEPALAGEAEALAAEAAWYRGERDELTVHLDHALELVEPLPASRSKAWILSQASRYAMLAGSGSQAIEYAGRALEMATALDLPDVRVHALNNRGSARAHGGDPGGIEDLEASATLAAELNSPEVARSLNNLASITYLFGDLRRCLDLERRSLAAGESFGLETLAQFERANMLGSLYHLGMWDEMDTRIEALLADAPTAGPEAAALAMRDLGGDLALVAGWEAARAVVAAHRPR